VITDDDVMRLFERADPARSDDVAPAVDPAGHLAALRTRSSNVTLIDAEPTPARPDNRHRRLLVTMAAAAAVVAVVVGALVLTGRGDSTEPLIPAGTTTPTTDTPASRAAEQLANRFIDARNAWDGDTVRSLLADGAVVEDFSVASADDVVAKSDFERIVGWRFLEPQCTTTDVGPPTVVRCTYAMEDSMSRALGAGPFTGSSFELVVVDGRIEHATHEFDFSRYDSEVFEIFAEWLDTNHPGDSDVMFRTAADGTWTPELTSEALALHSQRVREFEPVGIATRFVQARDAWDSETVRSLLADDATIDDFAVTGADEYAASIELDRITGWRFLRPACAAPVVGPPAGVICTYEMEDAWSRALGVGPYTGSSLQFVIADGHIQTVTHTFDYSDYSTEVFEVFWAWLKSEHPGDTAILFSMTSTGDAMRRLTPEAIALMEQRSAEFIASLDGSSAD
jgi:hypothetical protein